MYFSDRRNNNNAASLETAEYGFEDFVNPLSAAGAPNAVLDTGEDLNANGILDVYGQFPSYNGTFNTVPPGSSAPYVVGAISATATLMQGQAQVNRAVLFRHALKLINGNNISDLGGAGIGISGLSIVVREPGLRSGQLEFQRWRQQRFQRHACRHVDHRRCGHPAVERMERHRLVHVSVQPG